MNSANLQKADLNIKLIIVMAIRKGVMGFGRILSKSGFMLPAVSLVLCAALFSGAAGEHSQDDCGYYMCQYEEENIDTVILGHASESRTLMFGEIHDSVVAGGPPPTEDSLYVLSLLNRLKIIGYGYLALEVQENAPPTTHSHDMVACRDDFRSGRTIHSQDYPYAKPGWVELMIKAMHMGFKPVFFTIAGTGSDRDEEMFRAIKQRIFDQDSRARVIVYVGADHISELAQRTRRAGRTIVHRPLGLLLNDLTNGKNYSVYAGYPDDTPPGCDLIISGFVWNTRRLAIRRLQPSLKDVIRPTPAKGALES